MNIKRAKAVLQSVADLPKPLFECAHCSVFVIDAISGTRPIVCPYCGEPSNASNDRRIELDRKLNFAISEARSVLGLELYHWHNLWPTKTE